MAVKRYLGLCLIVVLTNIVCNEATRLRRIETRLNGIQDRFEELQSRFDRENRFRREDTMKLFEKIESIATMLNQSAEISQSHEQTDTSDENGDWRKDRQDRLRRKDIVTILKKIDNSISAAFNSLSNDTQCREYMETSDRSTDWRHDLMQLTRALQDEKLLNTEIRDQFLNIVNQVKTAVQSMDNRVEQMIQGVNDNIQDVATDMRIVLNGTDTNQIKLNNIIHEMAELKNVSLDLKEACISKNDISNMMCNNSNNVRPASCVELYESGNNVSGQYDVYPAGRTGPTRVYCDQETDGGGWTVFQRREDGSEDFYRGWEEYKNGFGNLDQEFWLGNELLSNLAIGKGHQLRIELENFDGERRFAKYDEFQIRPEDEKYTLKVSGYTGTAGDSLIYHNGSPFTTKDRDNDSTSRNCAVDRTGAWWYNNCAFSNLNGQYLSRYGDQRGICWYHFEQRHNSLKFSEMKFK